MHYRHSPGPALDFLEHGADEAVDSKCPPPPPIAAVVDDDVVVVVGGGEYPKWCSTAEALSCLAIWRQLEQSMVQTFLEGEELKNLLLLLPPMPMPLSMEELEKAPGETGEDPRRRMGKSPAPGTKILSILGCCG